MEVVGSVPALEPTPPRDLHIVDDAVAHSNVNVAVAHLDNVSFSHVPLHRKCSQKIKHLKSTFGCLSGSVLNQDGDNIAVNHPLDINDNANTNLSQPLRDGNNVASIAEENGVYDLYGFWKVRPRDPLGRGSPGLPLCLVR